MISAIIVDDEEQSRYGLGQYFDFSSHGIRISGYAGNGKEALAFIEKQACDLVITDVKMPEMDGIALAQAIRERYGDSIQIIFISGYDDFEYLQAALKLCASDYLLKPISPNEMDEVMARAAATVAARRQSTRREVQYQNELKASYAAVLEQYYARKLLHPGYDHPLPVPVFSEACVPDPMFCLILLQPDRSVAQDMIPMRDICSRLLSANQYECIVDLPDCEIGIILCRPADEIDMAAVTLSSSLSQSIQSRLQQGATISVSAPVHLRALSTAYNQAKQSLDYALSDEDRIILGKNAVHVRLPEQGYALSEEHIRSFTDLLKNGNAKGITALIANVIAGMQQKKGLTKEHCRVAILQVLLNAINVLADEGVTSYSRETDMAAISADIRSLNLLDDMRTYMEECYQEYIRLMHGNRLEYSSQVARQVKNIIKRRYQESLTIAELAREVYLSVPYVCTLFRQETGITINEYLTQYRMKKACQHLADRTYTLQQVSASVGYADSAYFSRLFRKVFGMSPNAYRKMRMQNE